MWTRDGGCCRQCGSQVELQFDHIIRSRWGELRPRRIFKSCAAPATAARARRSSRLADNPAHSRKMRQFLVQGGQSVPTERPHCRRNADSAWSDPLLPGRTHRRSPSTGFHVPGRYPSDPDQQLHVHQREGRGCRHVPRSGVDLRGMYRMVDERDGIFSTSESSVPTVRPSRPIRIPWDVHTEQNVEALISGFSGYLAAFETKEVFEGPSLYFHLRALERRGSASSAAALLQDELFLEYVYAVLPSWGMHRMGKQHAKVPPFEAFVGALQSCEPQIDQLWDLDITSLGDDEVEATGLQLWKIIASLRSSTSNSRLVSGSKTLHHVLPRLLPPIDRQYTFRFFTGTKAVTSAVRRHLFWHGGPTCA